MKCIIPGANVKVFGRAIHSLSKIGEELYVELLPNGLSLRTVNLARSAYACFVFAPTFFTAYDMQSSSAATSDESNVLRCKINMKSCVSVFKSLSVLEKTVDKCKVSMHLDEARLIFQLCCHHGIVKTHRLMFIECDSLEAVFAKNLCPNVMTAQTKLFSDAVVNFQTSQEEITLTATPLKLTIKNYVDDEPDANKAIRTELSLTPDEFDSYTVGVDTEVTFCLKELRAVLSFSESSNLPLSLHFETAGKPIIFAIDGDSTFEANFVLATLAVDLLPSSQPNSSIQPTPSTSRLQPPTDSIRRRKPEAAKPGKSRVSKSNAANRHTSSQQVDHNTEMDMDTFDIVNESVAGGRSFLGSQSASRTVPSVRPAASAVSSVPQQFEQRNAPRIDQPEVQGTGQASSATSRVAPSTPRLFALVSADSPEAPSSPFADLDSPRAAQRDSDEDVDNNVVPGTPPSKKFKSMFFGLSQSTTSGSQIVAAPAVLAEDSEED